MSKGPAEDGSEATSGGIMRWSCELCEYEKKTGNLISLSFTDCKDKTLLSQTFPCLFQIFNPPPSFMWSKDAQA